MARLKIQIAKEEAEEAAEKEAEAKRLAEVNGGSNGGDSGLGTNAEVEMVSFARGRNADVGQRAERGLTAEEQRKSRINRHFRQTTGKTPPPPSRSKQNWKKATRRLSALRIRKLKKKEDTNRRRASVASTGADDVFGFGAAIGMLESRRKEPLQTGSYAEGDAVVDVGTAEGEKMADDFAEREKIAGKGIEKKKARRMSAFGSRLHQRANKFKRTGVNQSTKKSFQ